MRKILIFLWLAFLSGLCNSQILTLQFGKNHSTIDGINGTEIKGFTEPLIGQNIFIGTDYWNKKFFNLSTNLGYINKKGEDGYWYTSPYGSSYITNKVDITYLTINTYFDLKFPILNTFYPYVSFGPRLDYLVKNENEANMEILTSYAIGLSMGGGLKAMISRLQIGVRADYNFNLNKPSRVPLMAGYTGFISEQEMIEKTFLIRFSIGYLLK